MATELAAAPPGGCEPRDPGGKPAAGAGKTLPKGPHQQLSFRTLCSSEALARDRTIFRVSFMAACLREGGRGSPATPEDLGSPAARRQGAGPASSGAGPASSLASR
ncbi:hypothetical protein MC885_021584 [Smutsia gigantea]|nr:hypothetical protein MC885_021584 [Smutsia gigantea]